VPSISVPVASETRSPLRPPVRSGMPGAGTNRPIWVPRSTAHDGQNLYRNGGSGAPPSQGLSSSCVTSRLPRALRPRRARETWDRASRNPQRDVRRQPGRGHPVRIRRMAGQPGFAGSPAPARSGWVAVRRCSARPILRGGMR
jgi:hypothetical protein